MFKKKPFECDAPIGAFHYCITKVIRKTDGDSVDLSLVRDFSENFNEFPRDLQSENFSLDAQTKSGISLKEVNSVVFHDDKLSEHELSAITAELEKDVKLKNED